MRSWRSLRRKSCGDRIYIEWLFTARLEQILCWQSSPLKNTKFDYSAFPDGFYHDVMLHGHPIRRAWHEQKFRRVIDSLPQRDGASILDIGCFAGTFLSLLPETRFSEQVGVDILKNQIDYATKHFATPFRRFIYAETLDAFDTEGRTFDCVSLIEVIEHLDAGEAERLLNKISRLLKPGGTVVITTPNYTSAWPLIEFLLGKFSDVGYEEQHITRFNYFTAIGKLYAIAPMLQREFSLNFRTTTHFLSPFLAIFSSGISRSVSQFADHKRWRFPFGSLLLLSFTRRADTH